MKTLECCCEEKDIGKILDNYAHQNYKDGVETWNLWLSWMCGVYEYSNIINNGGLLQTFSKAKEDNPYFFDAMRAYLEVAYKGIMSQGGCDALGGIYETCYQSSHKASVTGQFFTPVQVSDLMAKISGNGIKTDEGIIKHGDPCCGSGRLLISEWKYADKYDKNFFGAGDVDRTSVNMSAMNFMVNGMIGYVEQRDALTQNWSYGYIVNACKVPYANNSCCLQKFTDEHKFIAAQNVLIHLMKDWDVGKYRQKEKPIAPMPVSKEPVTEKVENSVCEKKSGPIQLNLFE